METDLIIGLAQVLTGAATFVVAIFLAGQLLIQRSALNRAHQDAERELAFASRSTINSIILGRLTSDGLASAVSRGFDDIDSLTDPSDLLRFTGYMRQTYQAFIMEWLLSRESVDVIEFEERMARLFIPRGGRQYYSSTGRAIVSLRSAELLDMFDDLYETYEGNPVPA